MCVCAERFTYMHAYKCKYLSSPCYTLLHEQLRYHPYGMSGFWRTLHVVETAVLLLLFRFAVFGHYCILAKTSNIDLKRLILFCFVLLSFQTFPAPPHLFFNTCPNKAHFSQSIPLVSTTANFVLRILSPCFVAVCFTRFILSIKATCFFHVLIFASQKNVCISFILCTAPLLRSPTFHFTRSSEL